MQVGRTGRGLLEIMSVIQQFRYREYIVRELEENILALDHPYFPSGGTDSSLETQTS